MLPTSDQIQRATYHVWLGRGRVYWRDRQDWLEAERKLTFRLNYPTIVEIAAKCEAFIISGRSYLKTLPAPATLLPSHLCSWEPSGHRVGEAGDMDTSRALSHPRKNKANANCSSVALSKRPGRGQVRAWRRGTSGCDRRFSAGACLSIRRTSASRGVDMWGLCSCRERLAF